MLVQLTFLCPKFCLVRVDACRWRLFIFNMAVFHYMNMQLSEHTILYLFFILWMDLGLFLIVEISNIV